jgi:micrococcal nuclease
MARKRQLLQRLRSWRWLAVVFLVMPVVVFVFAAPRLITTATDTDPSSPRFDVVARVVDGDTLVMRFGERIRLIGVDTPESVHPKKRVEHFAKEATEFTRKMVEGKSVRLEFDPANARANHKDNTEQKRTLAYLYLRDGTFLNAEIIRQGYGFALTRYPFKYMEEFRRLEREAREQGRGLWKAY